MLPATLFHSYYSGPFLLAWEFEPFMLLSLGMVAGLYWLGLRRIAQHGVRRVPRSYPAAFYLGLFALITALSGPFHTYNENSFTLHMGQHVMLMLIAAPLLVLGRPVQVALWAISPQRSGDVLGPVLRRRWVRGLLTVIANPLVVLAIVNVNLVLWHLPDLYVAALESTLVHEIEHALFLSTALLFWWVIIDPVPRHHRVRPDLAIGMLFVTGSIGDLLALYLIFAPDAIYPFYLASDTIWGMTQHADQRVGGLIMLVAGTVVYFGATFWLIARNYGNTDEMHSAASQMRHVSDAG